MQPGRIGGGFDDDERGPSRVSDLPPPSRADVVDDWRKVKESLPSFDQERKVVDTGVSETPTAVKTSPFGAGTPREQVLGERLASKKLDSDIEGSSQTSIPSRAHSNRSESLALNNVENVNPSGDAKPPQVLLEEQHSVDRPEPEGERMLKEEKEEKEAAIAPEAAFPEAAAKIDPSDLAAFLSEAPEVFSEVPSLLLARFVDYFGIVLSGVSFLWDDIFKEPVWSNLFYVIDLSHIPKPVHTEAAEWINQHLPYDEVRGFILWSFSYIMESVFIRGWKKGGGRIRKSNVSIFVALAMVLRSKPHVLSMILPSLRKKQLWYQGKGAVTSPLTVWMIAQASEDNLHVGLYSWAHNLLPLLQLVGSNAQSKDLILQLVEKILEKPDAVTELVNAPVLHRDQLIPPPSFEILLRLTFPATSAREEATTRFEKIYPLLKEVALTGAPEREAVIEQIFTFSLRLAGEGNPVLAKEATEIAIWSLTGNIVCWKRWNYLYKENLEASVALLKTLVEKLKDHSLKLSSLNHTLARAPESEAMKQVTQKIFTLSLRLAGEGNPVLAKEATEIAIWSLSKNVDCWKHWDILCKDNLEASVALLKTLVEKWKDHSLKLSSSSPSDTLGGAPESEAMKQVTQKIFTFSLRLAGEAKEATAIAIWSLTENVDLWKNWDNLYEENLEASVALLKRLVDEWKDHSLKLLSSPSDTLTLSQTMKSFRLMNNQAITEGGAKGSLYKEADKSCKVISRRLSRGSCSLKGTCITAVVLVTAVAAAALSLSESVSFL